MQLKRTFHPVGHGAFYTERIEGSDGSTFTVVFDCGRFETAKIGWSYYKYKAWIENYTDISSGLQTGDDIDILMMKRLGESWFWEKFIEYDAINRCRSD